MLFQQGPAETTAYMIAGYAVIFGVMLIYLASLAIRRRNLEQDLEVLQELEARETEPDQERVPVNLP
jgi:hypothetical protein